MGSTEPRYDRPVVPRRTNDPSPDRQPAPDLVDGAAGAARAATPPADPATAVPGTAEPFEGTPAEEVAWLRDVVRRQSERLAEALDEARLRRLEAATAAAQLQKAVEERDRVLRRFDRIRRNPVARAALRFVRGGRATVARARSRINGRRRTAVREGERRLRASADEERDLRDRIVAGLTGEPPTSGPRVSIVVLNRDGERHLRRLLPALVTTAYRDIDLTVVDNASRDGSVAYARRLQAPFPVALTVNAQNESFAAANNRAVAATDGELVLFLNNDVIPLEPGWLGRLVRTLGETDAAACGARLIFPRRSGPAVGPADEPGDLDLQHAGIDFPFVDGVPRGRNIGGRDACDPAVSGVREVPAATAACLLVRRDRFLAVGGFDEAYVYGYEDVDLCLRWRDRGERVVVDGGAVLWHDESATRRLQVDRATIDRQRENRRHFYARWGRPLFREGLLERLGNGAPDADGPPPGGPVPLGGGPLRAWVIGPRDDPRAATLQGGLAGLGWQVARHEPPSGDEPIAAGQAPDLAIVLAPDVDVRRLPRHVITVGWLTGSPAGWLAQPWFDELDLVLVPDEPTAAAVTAASSRRAVVCDPPSAEGLRAHLRAWAAARRFGILIQARDWDDAPTSGDYHFARAVQRQLERRGFPTSVYLRPAWTQPCSTRDDVALHLWGRYPLGPRPGQVSLLWILYHPELVTDELLDAYDLVLVASDPFAGELARRTRVPVRSLHQATDAERFAPGRPGPRHELLFVGNSRGIRRDVLHGLAATRHDLAVYGGGWDPEFVDPDRVRGSRVDNADLAGYYGSATVVLNDHWPEAAELGFLNNRLYDALAAGAFVISDRVAGMDEEFDRGVVMYEDAADLLGLVERYVPDEPARAAVAARGRAAVLARHTFAHRVDEMLRLVDEVAPAALPPSR